MKANIKNTSFDSLSAVESIQSQIVSSVCSLLPKPRFFPWNITDMQAKLIK